MMSVLGSRSAAKRARRQRRACRHPPQIRRPRLAQDAERRGENPAGALPSSVQTNRGTKESEVVVHQPAQDATDSPRSSTRSSGRPLVISAMRVLTRSSMASSRRRRAARRRAHGRALCECSWRPRCGYDRCGPGSGSPVRRCARGRERQERNKGAARVAFDDKSGMQDEMSVEPLFRQFRMTESTRNGISSLRISTIETSLRRWPEVECGVPTRIFGVCGCRSPRNRHVPSAISAISRADNAQGLRDAPAKTCVMKVRLATLATRLRRIRCVRQE